jgi:RND family efflux transporter MFP subunit
MLRKVHFIILLSLMLAGAGSSRANPGNQATPVTSAAVTRDTVIITEEAMGWIEAKVNPTVAAEVSGRIEKIFVDTGQVVKTGSPLLTIDSEQQKLEKEGLQSDISRLQALIKNQERTVKRYQSLLEKESISQERFDNAKVKLITLKQQLEGARSRLADNRRRLGNTSVFAPVGGWIEKRFVSKGDFVRPGTPLFLMVTDHLLRIVLPFPESVGSRLATGQEVKLTSPLSHDRIIEAHINQIRPAVNIHSRALEVIIYLDNPGAWRPGGTVNGTVIIDRHENGMLVPTRAVVRRPAGEVVYEIKDGKALQHKVTTGQRQGGLIEILDGLSGDEKIVVDGAGFLSNGAAVRETP